MDAILGFMETFVNIVVMDDDDRQINLTERIYYMSRWFRLAFHIRSSRERHHE